MRREYLSSVGSSVGQTDVNFRQYVPTSSFGNAVEVSIVRAVVPKCCYAERATLSSHANTAYRRYSRFDPEQVSHHLSADYPSLALTILPKLSADQLRLVQTSMLGSILSNLLLVLGMSFFA
jgi:hypothetical protein